MYSSGPWPLKILMFALLVTREIATDIDIKILGVPAPPPMRMCQCLGKVCLGGRGWVYFFACVWLGGGGGGGGLFISVRVFFPV